MKDKIELIRNHKYRTWEIIEDGKVIYSISYEDLYNLLNPKEEVFNANNYKIKYSEN